jgi:outer membrane protein
MGILKTLLCIVVLTLLVLCPFPGHCQDKKLTLDEALKIALEENREVRAFKNTVLAQKENIGVARSYLLPKINFEERAARTNNPPSAFMMKLNQQRFAMDDFALNNLNNPKSINDFQTAFSFEQPVFLMKSYLNLNSAKLEHSAKNEDYMRKREEVSLNVVRAYMRAHTAKEYLKVAGKGLEDAQEHMRIAEIRYKNGLGLYSDCLRAQTAMIEGEQKSVSAQKDFSVAKRWLGVLLGKSMPIDVADYDVSLTVREIDHYVNASNARRDVAAMKIRQKTSQNNVRLAESGYLPYVGVGGSYQLNDHSRLFGAEGYSWHLMAFLRWELFDGMNRESERKKAQFHMTEANERLRGLMEFIAFKVEEAYLAMEEAKKNAELSLAALKSAEEGHKLVKSRYENSLSPIVDLLDVQLNLNRARADAVARENDYKLAIINLSYESGTIMKDLGIE